MDKYYKVNIHIGVRTDKDLAALVESDGFSISGAIKMALRAYVNGKRIAIPIPDKLPEELEDKNIRVVFTYGKDDEVIGFLKGITQGHRSFVIKRILEYNLEWPAISNLSGQGTVKKADTKKKHDKPAPNGQNKDKQKEQKVLQEDVKKEQTEAVKQEVIAKENQQGENAQAGDNTFWNAMDQI